MTENPIFAAENAVTRCFRMCQTTKVPRNNIGGHWDSDPMSPTPGKINKMKTQKNFRAARDSARILLWCAFGDQNSVLVRSAHQNGSLTVSFLSSLAIAMRRGERAGGR